MGSFHAYHCHGVTILFVYQTRSYLERCKRHAFSFPKPLISQLVYTWVIVYSSRLPIAGRVVFA